MKKTDSFDVVVIGGGVAGAVAALAAREAGKSAACIAQAPGATALSSGAVDPLPETSPPGPLSHAERGDAPDTVPLSPRGGAVLSRVEGGTGDRGFLKDALSFAREAFLSLGLTGGAGAGGALVLPTVLGTWKKALLALSTQAPADLLSLEGRRLVVARFADVEAAGWRPGRELARQAADCFGVEIAAAQEIEIEFQALSRRMGAFETAAAIDADPSLAAMIGERIGRKVGNGAPSLVLVDPVLGIRDYARALREVEAAAGVSCAEMLPTVPSVPGRRWQNAIEAALANAGVRAIKARALGFKAAGHKVTSIGVSDGVTVNGTAFVLATGRFVGGGIRREAGFDEPLFDLPVVCAGTPNPDVPMGELVGRRISDRHTAFSAGVRVDDAMRPIGREGGPVFENLWAAGAVVGDRTVADGPSGMGNAILSGYLAGRAAAGLQ
ncbi:MAG: FAD-binding protein [Deltaproteobacteria bacterium]|nr:FAD-binding protein [Deltaproteobacteria bacterium]